METAKFSNVGTFPMGGIGDFKRMNSALDSMSPNDYWMWVSCGDRTMNLLHLPWCYYVPMQS